MAGGAAGSLARYVVTTAVLQRLAGWSMAGTFLVNVTGCFLAGLIMTYLSTLGISHPYWRLGLVAGFLGGYTTFSAFEYETFLAFRTGSASLAAVYAIGSVVAGFAAVWIGASIVKR